MAQQTMEIEVVETPAGRSPCPAEQGKVAGDILIVGACRCRFERFADILSEAGYRIRSASGAFAALQSVADKVPHLVLLDANSPDIGGLCSRLKEEKRLQSTPVLVITSPDAPDHTNYLEAGAADFITDPPQRHELLARVATHLKLRELSERLEETVQQRTASLLAVNDRLRREIVELQQSEKDVYENWRLLQSIIDNSTAIIYVKDLQGRYLLINTAYEEQFHVSRAWILGKTDYDIFPKENADAFRSFDQQVLGTGRALESEEAYSGEDGVVHTYLSTKAPLFDQQGRLYAICGISTDITERKRGEQDHLAHLSFLESLEQVDRSIREAETVDEMMTAVLDAALAIFDSDRAWLLYPCDPDAPSWRVPMERTRSRYPGALAMGVEVPTTEAIREAFTLALQGGEPVVYDPCSGRSVPPDVASKFSVRSQMLVAVYPKRGKPWLFGLHQCSYPRIWEGEDVRLFKEISRRIADALSSLLFLRETQESREKLTKLTEGLEQRVLNRTKELAEANEDLTLLARRLETAYDSLREETEERLKVMEELREKDRMLIQQSHLASMGELISSIAHHWRQPLNLLGLIILENALQYGSLPEEQVKKNSTRAMQVVRELSRTIDDFGYFFRTNEQRGSFRVKEVVAKAVSLVEVGLREQHLRLELVIEDEEMVIEGYQRDYFQSLLNILSNAKDACCDRGVEDPRIVVRQFRDKDQAVVTVTDNAGGLSEQVMPRVFEPYFTTRGPGEGAGMGLYMAKIIIEKNMQGKLTVRNFDGGAEFRIEVAESHI